jgi:hypothetical protein
MDIRYLSNTQDKFYEWLHDLLKTWSLYSHHSSKSISFVATPKLNIKRCPPPPILPNLVTVLLHFCQATSYCKLRAKIDSDGKNMMLSSTGDRHWAGLKKTNLTRSGLLESCMYVCMYMYACMHVCMYVWMYMCVCMYVCSRVVNCTSIESTDSQNEPAPTSAPSTGWMLFCLSYGWSSNKLMSSDCTLLTHSTSL